MKRSLFITSLLFFYNLVLAQDIEVPEWITNNDTIKKSDISVEDYPYLRNWIYSNSVPADDYFYNLFSDHQLVIVGEQHNIKEHKEFIIDRIDSLYHKCGVRAIGWEFSGYSDNERLHKLVNMPVYDSLAVLEFARDQTAHEWNSKDHWDIIKAVWRLNVSLDNNQPKMKLIGIDINEDISDVVIDLYTKPDTSPEHANALKTVIMRDKVMAKHVSDEIMDKDLKGFVFVGRCHDYTHHTLNSDNPIAKYIMGNELHKKYGNKVFQVWLYSGWFEIMDEILNKEAREMIAFSIYNSPFANILQHTGWQNDQPAPFSDIARGFIYLVPANKLHKNTTIKGFVNEEMFREYNDSYKLNFGDNFKTAKELDNYLQENRW